MVSFLSVKIATILFEVSVVTGWGRVRVRLASVLAHVACMGNAALSGFAVCTGDVSWELEWKVARAIDVGLVEGALVVVRAVFLVVDYVVENPWRKDDTWELE